MTHTKVTPFTPAGFKGGGRFSEKLTEPLFKNSFFLLATNLTTSSMHFIFWAAAAKLYSSTDIGLCGALVSAASLISSLALLGLNFGLLRFLRADCHKKILVNTCLTLAFLSSAAFSIGFFILVPSLSLSLTWDVLFFMLVASVALCYVCGGAFIASRSAKFSFMRNASMVFLQVSLLPFAVSFGAMGIFSCFSVAAFASFFVALGFLSRVIKKYSFTPCLDRQHLHHVFHLSFDNYLVENFSMLPRYVLPLVILGVLGARENAYFSVAFTVAHLLFLAPAAVSNSLFAEGSHDESGFGRNVKKSIRLIFLLLAAGILIVFAFGRSILSFFGQEYVENAYVPLCLLSLASLAYAVIRIYATVKNIELHLRPVIFVSGASAVLSLGFAAFFMSSLGLGVTGAAAGFLLGHAGGALCAIILSKSHFLGYAVYGLTRRVSVLSMVFSKK